MGLPITGATRDEVARILEQVAKEGLAHPRNLDAAIDAISAAFQVQLVMLVTDPKGTDAFIMGGDILDGDGMNEARDSFGISMDVQQGYAIFDEEKVRT